MTSTSRPLRPTPLHLQSPAPLLIPLDVHLNSTVNSSLEKSLYCTLTKGAKDRGPRLPRRYSSPPSQLNVFSHLSLADPLPLSPTLRCETDRGAWPLAKVNRALNCVWALHHTPTTAEIKHRSSPRLPLTTLSEQNCLAAPFLYPVGSEPSPAHSRPDQTLSPAWNFPVWTSMNLPTFIKTIRSWIFETWWLIGAIFFFANLLQFGTVFTRMLWSIWQLLDHIRI